MMSKFRNAAQRLSMRSVELVEAGERDGWLDLLTEDADVCAPSGT